MKKSTRKLLQHVFLIILIGLLTGCAEKPSDKPVVEEDKAPTASSTKESPGSNKRVAQKRSEPAKPVVPTIPKVMLTKSLESTCLVKVGDPMPLVTLSDLAGVKTPLPTLFGPRLTVVCFWKSDHLYSLEELSFLQKHIGPLAGDGVALVGINEADPPTVAVETFQKTAARFPCLLDNDGKYFLKVATEKLPRTYLLDAQGKIIWFDIEYSRSTQRDLKQAIEVALGKKK
jgi:peroxiredoxin